MIDVAPLRDSRDFRLFFLGQLVSMLGSQLTMVAIPYQVYRQTHSSFQVGAVSLVQLVPLVICSLAGGSYVDAWDRRRMMLWSFAALALTSAGLALNASAMHPQLWALYVISALGAGLTGFVSPARMAVVPSVVPSSQLVPAFAFMQVVIQVGTVVGPALAGLLIAAADLALVYGIDAATFVVAMVTVFLMRPMRPTGHTERPGWRAFVEGVRYLRGRQAVQGAYLIDINAMVFGMPRALFPAMAETVFHGGALTLGLLYAAPGAGALVGALTTGWVNGIRRQGFAVIVAVIVWGASIAVFGFVDTLGLALVLLAVAGWADVISAVLRNAIILAAAPDAMRGRLASFQSAVVQSGPRLGDMEAGTVAALTSTTFSVVSGGLACIAGALVLARLMPGFRDQVADVPDAETPS
jgi:MFS family permease